MDKTQEDQGGERRQNGGEPKQMVKPGWGWWSVGRWVVQRAAKTVGDACIAMLTEGRSGTGRGDRRVNTA